MTTIPANQIANVVPSVLSAGGSSIDVIGLLLTENAEVPVGTVLSFSDSQSVADYFGAGSTEATAAATYFAGFENAPKRPAAILFAQYNADEAAAYLRGGDVSALTLAALQSISGSLDIVFDGVARNASSINLSAATSFSSAATIIQTALNAASPSAASVTGSIGGVVTASAGATFTGTGSGTNLTTSTGTGVIHVGAAITGTGVPAGTYIVSQTSGPAGGDGVYVTNHATTSSGDALTATSNTLDVTGLTSGTLQATDAISGTGVAAGTTVLAQISGTPGGIGLYTLSSAQQFASATVTSLSTILNVTAVGSGTIEVGAVLSGTNVAAGTAVTALGTGSGDVGTYTVSKASTTISETITASAANVAVTYSSVSGAFTIASGITGVNSSAAFATGTTAASLMLTSATGAVLSQGAAAASPATFMDAVVVQTTDWVTFMTLFDPDATGNTVKLAFAAWTTLQNNRYAYVCWDLDVTPSASEPATGSMGYILEQNGNSGTVLLGGEAAAGWDAAAGIQLAAFFCGAAASIDFTETNGRITFAFKSQSGIAGTVTTATGAVNLGGNPQASGRGNGYNFYGAYGAANDNFIWFQRGFITGSFLWADSFINQVWLNSLFQDAMLTLLGNARSIPFNPAGDALIQAGLNDTIEAGLNFGAYAPGDISSAQIAEVNAMAGVNIANTLQTQGWFLQLTAASSSVRAARGPKRGTFWYLDRGSIQSISLNSVAVQ